MNNPSVIPRFRLRQSKQKVPLPPLPSAEFRANWLKGAAEKIRGKRRQRALKEAAAWKMFSRMPKRHRPDAYDLGWKSAYEHINFLLACACKGERTLWHLRNLVDRIVSGMVAIGGNGSREAVDASLETVTEVLKRFQVLEQHRRNELRRCAQKFVSWPAFISPLPSSSKENEQKLKDLRVGNRSQLRVIGGAKWRTSTPAVDVALQLIIYIQDPLRL